MDNKKRTKSTTIFIFYNLTVVLIFTALIELTLNILYRNPTRIPTFARKAFAQYYSQVGRKTIQVEPACAQYNPELFYLLKPGACNFENIEFSTPVEINQKGLRDTDAALNFPEIVFLGDSFTMGWGVYQDQAFPQLIRTSGKRTLNAGVSSYGTVREMLLLKLIDSDSSGIVIIQYHANDAPENTEYLAKNKSLPVSSQDRYDSLCEAYEKGKKYYPGKMLSKIGRFLIKDMLIPGKEKPRDYHLEAVNFLQVLLSFDQLKLKKMVIFEIGSRKQNSNLFVNALEQEINSGEYPDHVKNAILVRLENEFTDTDYFILDDHLNSKGHQKLANSLLKFL